MIVGYEVLSSIAVYDQDISQWRLKEQQLKNWFEPTSQNKIDGVFLFRHLMWIQGNKSVAHWNKIE